MNSPSDELDNEIAKHQSEEKYPLSPSNTHREQGSNRNKQIFEDVTDRINDRK
jgi:hypothetical protein